MHPHKFRASIKTIKIAFCKAKTQLQHKIAKTLPPLLSTLTLQLFQVPLSGISFLCISFEELDSGVMDSHINSIRSANIDFRRI